MSSSMPHERPETLTPGTEGTAPVRRPFLMLTLLLLFGAVSLLMVSGSVSHWDDRVLEWAGAGRNDFATNLMIALTTIGDGLVLVPLGLGICLLLYLRGRSQCARHLLLAGLSGEVIYLLAKAVFQRPRPTVIPRLSGAGWYSYPSGHTMMTVVVLTMALLLLARATRTTVWRVPLAVLAFALPLGVAASRVYLGVHYLTDVLAALCLGGAMVLYWWDRTGAPTGA